MSNVKEISDTNFETEVLKSPTPTLVDFWATWCGPCRALAPKVEQLSQEFSGKIKFTKIDVDDNPKTPSKYGIRGVPTLIVFKNGQVFKQSVGDLSVENLKSFLNSAL
ncbi:MAG: thioredoxin [Deltaproteobacteria bacterium GWA2_38_16]|nr:MAG: thioredoxin [Deltaproteobacteria bacterium GWA2_38_16]OGQ03221.1 MAG: thioredoxin [Deltaproteobacteria bacterium RIFCSPHIGHO2_02_FULL_38_15]OGQ34645.1 MAG: thioredoxin [Deltaproteobacteria bacterium RIFCSPLOWO2_01_FULL_38_9]OGQ59814.1 MAG: thioredoxin [Deltaproteobacteria bacterium RIFCSPLOWO2_12_FULL_38_8]HBQ20352.1 thioredoxin [Deltaproteobacteria bacterium]